MQTLGGFYLSKEDFHELGSMGKMSLPVGLQDPAALC